MYGFFTPFLEIVTETLYPMSLSGIAATGLKGFTSVQSKPNQLSSFQLIENA